MFPEMRRASKEVIPKERNAIKLSLTLKKNQNMLFFILNFVFKNGFRNIN